MQTLKCFTVKNNSKQSAVIYQSTVNGVKYSTVCAIRKAPVECSVVAGRVAKPSSQRPH